MVGIARVAGVLWFTIRRLLIAAALAIPALAGSAAFAQNEATPLAQERRQPLPNFEMKQYRGDAIDLATYRGQVVLVNFWATWCLPCITEFPTLQALKARFANQPFEILAVNMGEPEDAIAGFLDSLANAVNFPILLDRPPATVAQTWPVRALPTTIMVDKSGRLAHKTTGQRTWNNPESQALIRSLLDETNPDY